jgi:hypothetical protein
MLAPELSGLAGPGITMFKLITSVLHIGSMTSGPILHFSCG